MKNTISQIDQSTVTKDESLPPDKEVYERPSFECVPLDQILFGGAASGPDVLGFPNRA
jgi:hypothetical protein